MSAARSGRACWSSTTTPAWSRTSPRSWRAPATRCAARAPARRRSRSRGEGFDVALVDLKLPDGDGTALAPRLKELSPDGEVVLLTGFATLESAMAAVRAGRLRLPGEALRHAGAAGHRRAGACARCGCTREKRELARRAQMAEKLAAVGTMTAGLSHEIRNPLNAAALQLSVLERRVQRLAARRAAAAARAAHAGEGRDPPARPHPRGLPPVRPPARVRAAAGRGGAAWWRKVLDLLGGDAERRGVAAGAGPRRRCRRWRATRSGSGRCS